MYIALIDFVAAISALLIAGTAMAQDDEFTFNASLKAGWHFFQDEPFSDTVENNWLVGGDVIVWHESGFGAGVDVKFLTKDQDNEDIDDWDVDFEFTQIPISINAYYRVVDEANEFTPYFGAGLAVVYSDITATAYGYGLGGAKIETDETSYGVDFIAGVQYGNFYVEGQYIWSEAEFEDIAFMKEDTEDDLNVGGFNVAVGFRF